PRAKRAELLHTRLAADRAGFRGLGGGVQRGGLSCGGQLQRWHLRILMASMAFSMETPSRADMASTVKHGIYGVCASDDASFAMASTPGHGIYGKTRHQRRPAAFAKCGRSRRGIDPAEMDRIALARQQRNRLIERKSDHVAVGADHLDDERP